MTNSPKLKNILTLTKFLYQDAFHGLFKRPFFQNKRNRCLLITALILLYLAYFYVNMVAFVRLSAGAAHVQLNTFSLIARTTLSSCYNLFLIISCLVFILVNANFNLSRNSLFFIKTLPFKRKEILLSLSIFRFSFGLAIFELFLIIAAPTLKLLRLSLLESFLVLVTFHLLFFTIFQLLELIYAAVTKLKSKWNKYFPLFLDAVLIFLSGIYYFHTRLLVDSYWAAQRISLLMITIYLLAGLCVIAATTLVCRWRLPSEIEGRIKSSFIHIVPRSLPLKLVGMPWIAVLRFKITSYYALVSVGLVVISVYFSGWNAMMQNMLFIFPLIGVVWIFYADALLNFRPLFGLYRIHLCVELFAILLAMAFILLPSLLVGLMTHVAADPFFFGLGISLASLIAGFLFPKSQGNMNESLSALLSIIMMLLLASLINIPSALYAVDGLLLLLTGYILNKEKKVKS